MNDTLTTWVGLAQDLLSSMNFARNFIDDLLLPWGVERIIYMDVDTIVQVRLAEETQHPLPRPP